MRPISLGFITVATPGTPTSVGSVMATVVGTQVGPFTITIGVNDALLLSIDAGSDQLVTLTNGTRTAAQVASDINTQTTGLTASAAAGKIVISSNSVGSTSSVLIQAVNNSAYSALGLTTGKVSGQDDMICSKIRLTPLKGNAGDVYVGCKVNFDKTTGDGVLDRLMKPLATPATLDTFNVESQSDVDVLHSKEYFIDADQANDGVMAVLWVV